MFHILDQSVLLALYNLEHHVNLNSILLPHLSLDSCSQRLDHKPVVIHDKSSIIHGKMREI